jgi:hypothetical protein
VDVGIDVVVLVVDVNVLVNVEIDVVVIVAVRIDVVVIVGAGLFVSPLPNTRICDRMFGINFFSCPESVKSRVQEIVIEYKEIGMILHDVRNRVFLVYLI